MRVQLWPRRMRARGLCVVCWRAMKDDDTRLAHRECYRAQREGRRNADIRAHPPRLYPVRKYPKAS